MTFAPTLFTSQGSSMIHRPESREIRSSGDAMQGESNRLYGMASVTEADQTMADYISDHLWKANVN